MPLEYCHRLAESKYQLNLLIGTYSFTANNCILAPEMYHIWKEKKAQDIKYLGTNEKEEKQVFHLFKKGYTKYLDIKNTAYRPK